MNALQGEYDSLESLIPGLPDSLVIRHVWPKMLPNQDEDLFDRFKFFAFQRLVCCAWKNFVTHTPIWEEVLAEWMEDLRADVDYFWDNLGEDGFYNMDPLVHRQPCRCVYHRELEGISNDIAQSLRI